MASGSWRLFKLQETNCYNWIPMQHVMHFNWTANSIDIGLSFSEQIVYRSQLSKNILHSYHMNSLFYLLVRCGTSCEWIYPLFPHCFLPFAHFCLDLMALTFYIQPAAFRSHALLLQANGNASLWSYLGFKLKGNGKGKNQGVDAANLTLTAAPDKWLHVWQAGKKTKLIFPALHDFCIVMSRST